MMKNPSGGSNLPISLRCTKGWLQNLYFCSCKSNHREWNTLQASECEQFSYIHGVVKTRCLCNNGLIYLLSLRCRDYHRKLWLPRMISFKNSISWRNYPVLLAPFLEMMRNNEEEGGVRTRGYFYMGVYLPDLTHEHRQGLQSSHQKCEKQYWKLVNF